MLSRGSTTSFRRSGILIVHHPIRMSSAPSARITSLDAVKALGMFLVFFGHAVERLQSQAGDAALEVMRSVYAFHMPLFFFLAGVFFRGPRGHPGRWLLDKLRTRLLPVLFFGLLALPLWMSKEGSIAGPIAMARAYLRGEPMLCWPTWFLVGLFATECLAALVWWAARNRSRMLLVIGAVVAGALGWWFTDGGHPWEPWVGLPERFWYFSTALVALPFHLAGSLAKPWLMTPCRRSREIPLAGLSLLILMVGVFLNRGAFSAAPEVVMMVLASHGLPWWFYTGAFAGITLSMALCRWVDPHHIVVRFVGENTLIYLGMAGLALHFVDGVVLNALPWKATGVAAVVFTAGIYTVAVMAFFTPAVFAIRRWLPFAVGMKPMSPVQERSRISTS